MIWLWHLPALILYLTLFVVVIERQLMKKTSHDTWYDWYLWILISPISFVVAVIALIMIRIKHP